MRETAPNIDLKYANKIMATAIMSDTVIVLMIEMWYKQPMSDE